ncbi:MAG TPA: ABC transporter permease [Dehalococcoidia bacterium]|nr:ABC transporter permease [Dehalococcoidia bacterium]
MTQYVIRRILYLFPVLIGVSLITFVLMRMVPGDVAQVALGTNATEESLDQFRDAYGLNEPLFDWKPPFGQYGQWIGGLVQGDFGESYYYRTAVRDDLAQRLPVTLQLMIMAMAVMVVIAIPAGIIAGVRPNSLLDLVMRTTAVFGLSIPGFWLGTMFMMLPAIWFNWMAPTGHVSFFGDPMGNLQQFALPSLALGIPGAAGVMRFTRSSVLEVLRQDYVRTAWSKGLRERTVIMRHVLKNGLIPIVTIVGLQTGALMGGALIMERIFSLPGVGMYTYQSILTRDYLGVQAIVVLAAVVYVFINLAIDISYAWLDPRIRYT